MKYVDEMTIKDLQKGSKGDIYKSPQKAKKMTASLAKVGMNVNKEVEVFISVPSESSKRKRYKTVITLLDYKDIRNDSDIDVKEKVRLSMDGDVLVGCNCPAQLWHGYEYMMLQLDAASDTVTHDPSGYTVKPRDPSLFPKIRNPQLTGTTCKHLQVALKVLKANWNSIAAELKKLGEK